MIKDIDYYKFFHESNVKHLQVLPFLKILFFYISCYCKLIVFWFGCDFMLRKYLIDNQSKLLIPTETRLHYRISHHNQIPV